MKTRIGLSLFIGCVLTMTAMAQWPKLREELQKHAIDTRGVSGDELDRTITSYGVENADDLFIIGYFRLATDKNVLDDSVRILVFDKRLARWSDTVMPRDRQSTVEGVASWSLGSVLEIRHSSRYLYLDTHLSPSAGIILLLTRELQPVTTLFGWTLRLLPGGRLLYHRGMVHFAPTHPAEVWIFDERATRDTVLYPRKPYEPIRRAYIDTVRTIYERLGEDWFMKNNHHMDPEQFGSSVNEPIVASDDGNAIAFVAHFGVGDRVETPVWEVVIVMTGIDSPEPLCREQRLSDLQQLHPGWSIEQILREQIGK
ncbi:MAG TPA: hypothetical protein VII11_04585 [Bacteroidota bacterium]